MSAARAGSCMASTERLAVLVVLNEAEMFLSTQVGDLRQLNAVRRGLRNRSGMPASSSWWATPLGARGECAVAKLLGVYWRPEVGVTDATDVLDMQVRTRSEHWHELPCHKRDRDDQRFILVTGNGPEFYVHGWQWGRVVKQERNWKLLPGTKQPAFYLPHDELEPIDEAFKQHALEQYTRRLLGEG